MIEPVFNPVWVFLSTGEQPGSHAMIGGGLILTAVTAASVISVLQSRQDLAGPEPDGEARAEARS